MHFLLYLNLLLSAFGCNQPSKGNPYKCFACIAQPGCRWKDKGGCTANKGTSDCSTLLATTNHGNVYPWRRIESSDGNWKALLKEQFEFRVLSQNVGSFGADINRAGPSTTIDGQSCPNNPAECGSWLGATFNNIVDAHFPNQALPAFQGQGGPAYEQFINAQWTQYQQAEAALGAAIGTHRSNPVKKAALFHLFCTVDQNIGRTFSHWLKLAAMDMNGETVTFATPFQPAWTYDITTNNWPVIHVDRTYTALLHVFQQPRIQYRVRYTFDLDVLQPGSNGMTPRSAHLEWHIVDPNYKGFTKAMETVWLTELAAAGDLTTAAKAKPLF